MTPLHGGGPTLKWLPLMQRTIMILLGVLAFLIGTGLILPALAKLKTGTQTEAWPLPLGILLVLVGVSAALYGMMRRKARS